MKRNARVGIFLGLVAAVAVNSDCMAVAKKSGTSSAKQSAIQNGTTVRTRLTPTGIYDQECYDAYYGCMDQFCIPENSSGGSCACSDANAKYEKQLEDIQNIFQEAERIRTIEVEKVQAGAKADIIFTGERRYDEDGNILNIGEESAADAKKKRRQELMDMFNTMNDDEEEDFNIADKVGDELFETAEQICVDQIPDKCDKDMKFLHQLYLRQIASDCKGFENSLAEQKTKAQRELDLANGEVRNAMKESLDSANKYDLGQCMVEFKKCMLTDDACGTDWVNCVSTIASENMQNNKTVNVAGTKVASGFDADADIIDKTGGQVANTYNIAASTLERLDAKRTICEHVLDQCVIVRKEVWPAFLREAAPTIKVAESKVESKFRQSCLTDISRCIQQACKDDIVGKGTGTMDACLARPDMARSFCKVEIDPCERMEPQIWDYVKDKLAAMRVDACTQEVKDCLTDDTRCGSDYSNCIGMDYDYIHQMCPVDKLVVCKQTKPGFSMSDLDDMLMGLYLNIDNSLLQNCENLVDKKMAEICGSTSDCNRFAADDIIGTGSLRSQKDKDIYRVTGMISFGSIKVGDATGTTRDGDRLLKPGEVGVQGYIDNVNNNITHKGNENSAIISSIEEELNNIAGTINRTIQIIEQDPEIQFCVNGRNLEQITGQSKDKAEARFPNLLNQVKMLIAVAALRQAQTNYNVKLSQEIAKATQGADIDFAQYMCQHMAVGDDESGDELGEASKLTKPFAISYDVAVGLSTADLLKGGYSNKESNVVSAHKKNKKEYKAGGTETTRTAVFDRNTRTCHVCVQTNTSSCNVKKWGKKADCTVTAGAEQCKDISM